MGDPVSPPHPCAAPAGLVGGLVLTHQLGADTAALGNLQAILLRPGAHRRTVNPRASRSSLAATIPASGYPPARLDVGRKVTFQLGSVTRAQVDLVRHAVQGERHGFSILRSVEVISNH